MEKMKNNLPYMPFYIGDWRKCPEVRSLNLSARALWFEMLCLMWESERRGYLEIAGKAINEETLGRMVGEHTEVVKVLLGEIEEKKVFSREKNTEIIFNRRMVRDDEIRVSRSKAGRKGMKSRYNKTPNKSTTNTDNDIDIDIEDINAIKKEKEGLGGKENGLDFLDIWYSLYPKKVGRGAVEKAWEKVPNKEAVAALIIKALEWQVKSEQWYKSDGDYIPNPATYINQKRWLDERKENASICF